MTISSSSLSLGTGSSTGLVFLAITGLVSYVSEFLARLLWPGVVILGVVVVVGPALALSDMIDVRVSWLTLNPAFSPPAENLFRLWNIDDSGCIEFLGDNFPLAKSSGSVIGNGSD